MKKIIIVGKAGSGKDFLAKKFISKGWKKTVSFTSRPPREGEQDGIDYRFVSEKEFENLIRVDFFFEYKQFNGWYYGTSLLDWNNSNIFIFTPSGIEDLKQRGYLKDCFIIYLDISEYYRRKRLNQRSDSDSVSRRIKADKIDFKNFTNYDIRINNHLF